MTPSRGPSRPRAAAWGTRLREGFSEVGRAFPVAHAETRAATGLPGPTILSPAPDPFSCQSLKILPILEGTEYMSHLLNSLHCLHEPRLCPSPALWVPHSAGAPVCPFGGLSRPLGSLCAQ